MPVVSMFLGGVNFEEWKITLPQLFGTPAADAAPITLNYGNLISTIINFIILAFVIFLMVKAINKHREQEAVGKKLQEKAAGEAESAPIPKPTVEERLSNILTELQKK